MSFIDFENSLARDSRPPAGLSVPLQALWLEAKGDWSGAHSLAQQVDDAAGRAGGARHGAWVHAYLHRKEGDEANASYWYARAGKPVAQGELDAERREIVQALLNLAGG